MSKRIIIPALILVLFLVGSYGAARPFAAEIAAGRGEYALAMRLDPSNAKFYAASGEGYLKEGRASKDEEAWRKAKKAYAKAIALNPTNSRYYIGWAEAEAWLLSHRGVVPAADMDGYVDNLKRAIIYDPNGYFINAAAGYYLLLFKARLTESDRNFAIYRLRYALELNPDYRNEVFSYVANGLGDFKILQQITPRSQVWQRALLDFLRDIDKWKYRQ